MRKVLVVGMRGESTWVRIRWSSVHLAFTLTPTPYPTHLQFFLEREREEGLEVAGLCESRAEKGTKSLYFLPEGGAEDRGLLAGAGEHNSFSVRAAALWWGERPVSQGLPGISEGGPQGMCILQVWKGRKVEGSLKGQFG